MQHLKPSASDKVESDLENYDAAVMAVAATCPWSELNGVKNVM